jgi:hypothetical protein
MEFMMEGSSANVAHVERFEPVPPVVSVTTPKPRRMQPNSKPKRVHKKKVVVASTLVDDEATVGGRWSDDAINNILDLYQEEWIRIDKGNLKPKHWTHIHTEHHRQMPLAVRRKEEHIKGKIEKLKAEWRVQKNSPEEATGGEGSSWHWFERMSEILTGSAKGEGVPGEVDMGTTVLLSEDEDDIVVLEEGGIPKTPMSTASGEQSFSTPTTVASEQVVSPKTASCMKPGVDGKPNSRKRALTGNAAYMADAITKFAEGSFQVERHKMEAQERMHNIQMETNKAIAMKQMDIEMETRRLDMEARREAAAMQLRIAELFSNNLHSTRNSTP